MKKNDGMLKEYVRRLSNDDLQCIYELMVHNQPGDLANSADFLSQDKEMDRWLASAKIGKEWFDMMDCVKDFVKREYAYRADNAAYNASYNAV